MIRGYYSQEPGTNMETVPTSAIPTGWTHPAQSSAPSKRSRESPTSQVDLSSFKRLKVVDDSSFSHDSSAQWNNPIHPQSHPQPHMQSEHSFNDQAHVTNSPYSVANHEPLDVQSSGQRSAERVSPVVAPSDYQSMNSLLGSLHLLHRQRAGDVPPQSATTQVSSVESSTHNLPARRPPGARKKGVSLRISSKLY